VSDDKKQSEPDDFGLINARDEAQILAELAGVPVLDFVYINKRGAAELTYVGTKWAVRELAQRGEAIRLTHDPVVGRCPIDPEYITVTIRGARFKVDREAHCETMLDTSVGAARNWKSQKLTDGRTIPDENFFKKAVGIASRNAMQALLPQEFLREMIDILADKRRALERGEKLPAKAKVAASPAKQPDAAPSASQAQPPAKSAELPAKPAGPAPAAAPAKSAELPAKPAVPAKPEEPVKPGERTIRQKLFVTLNHFAADTAGKRQLLLELTGKDSSKELPDLDVTRLTFALERCLPGKINELLLNPDGTRYIFEKPTKNILHGKRIAAAAEAPASAPAGAPGEEEEPF
jgi:hypothetical protein